MKITAMIAAALLMTAGAQSKPGNARYVTVYSRNGIVVPFAIRAQAGALAADIFAGIGVTLNLRDGNPPASEAAPIIIEFDDRTPETLLPRAWAYSLPFEGVHIRIFWDRMCLEEFPYQLLAHVMVHEITHIIQGSDLHAREGIMNAHWAGKERWGMGRKPLHFTDADVLLIYQGLDSRREGIR